ncbi:MAG: hypothetical protein PVH02_03540 [Desulfobacteraceae bacterium]
MCLFKYARFLIFFSVLFFAAIALLGCATSSQIQALQEETQRALAMAEKALNEAKAARKASETCCVESAKNAQKAENAASKAENAALRAKKAAKDADYSAHRAEAMNKMCEDIYEKITSK